MQKIKIMTDSACDISKEYEEQLGIKILSFPITLGDKGFRERIDITNEEFYEMITSSSDFPKTSQITAFEFEEIYPEIMAEGYTDLIYVAIASKGSNTYSSATMARDTFYEEHPEAKDSFKIHIVDSKNYTGVYGYPVVQAAQKVAKGGSVDEIISYLEDWFDSAEVHFGCYTLEFVKKSGRVSCAAAFVGELLGLRPIIKIADAVSTTEAKVRGDKAVIPKLVEIGVSAMIPQTPYSMIYGSNMDKAKEMADVLTKRLGYPPEMYFQIGAAVASNVGPNIVGLVIKANKGAD